jgi:Ni/Fe-hydrogenase subunit HybB-like protein
MATMQRMGIGRMILWVLVALGLISMLARLFLGLGATTNLSDGYPWGLWISFDILAGVALAGGGFTLSATIYIFNLKKFEVLLRPAKISAFLGYMMFIFGLFFDLGLPWRMYHALYMWNTHSVLFEVAWCVMLYTTVLSMDILIMALERWKMEGPLEIIKSVYIALVVAGIMLSTAHQSSLGALFLLLPEKMSALWATKAIGPLFLASAIIGGMSMVTMESLISSRVHKKKPEMYVLSSLAKGLALALLAYFLMKVTDLYARNVTVWQWDLQHLFFYLELFGTVALPALLLTFAEIRTSPNALLGVAALTVFGVVLNRFNVALISYGGYADYHYFPSIMEILITVSLVAGGILIFEFLTSYLPVYKEEATAS